MKKFLIINNIGDEKLFILKKSVLDVKISNGCVCITLIGSHENSYNIYPKVNESLLDLYNSVKQQFSENEIIETPSNYDETRFFNINNIKFFKVIRDENDIYLKMIFGCNVYTDYDDDDDLIVRVLDSVKTLTFNSSDTYEKFISELISKIENNL